MFRLHLEARNPALNQARVYFMDMRQDLLGDWVLKIGYGRMGSQGCEKIYAFASPEQALPKVKAILRTRASAPHRLGCPYKIIKAEQEGYFTSLNIAALLQPPSAQRQIRSLVKSSLPSVLPLFEK